MSARSLRMFNWIVLLLVATDVPDTYSTEQQDEGHNITCNVTRILDACAFDLLKSDQDALHEEARRIAQCLTNKTQQSEEGASNRTYDLSEDRVCFIEIMKGHKNLNNTGNDKILRLSMNFESGNERGNFYEFGCVKCLFIQIHEVVMLEGNNTRCEIGTKVGRNLITVIKSVRDIMSGNETVVFKNALIQSVLRFRNRDKCSAVGFLNMPFTLIYKEDETYFGIPAEQVGGTTGVAILVFLYISGWILNCVLIKIFIRHEDMRKDSKLIVLNIAIADILNLTHHNPPIDIFLVNSIHSPLSVTYVFYVIIGLNIYSVMLLSCHIYLTVLPINNRRDPNTRIIRQYTPHATLLTAWLLATLAPVPLSFIIEEYYNASLYVLVSYCVVPLCWATVFSVATSLQLGLCVESIHCGSSGQETIRSARARSANTLVALIVVSAVSYVPYCCLPFIPPYIGEQSDDHPFLISWIFVWFNAFVNPIALYVANRDFRRYFNRYLCFCCCRSNE